MSSRKFYFSPALPKKKKQSRTQGHQAQFGRRVGRQERQALAKANNQTYCLFCNQAKKIHLKKMYNLALIASSVLCYSNKMYPMALMCLSPLSGLNVASFPHVLVSSWCPPVPNPILESQVLQLPSLPRIPILALEWAMSLHTALNPSLLQLVCREA